MLDGWVLDSLEEDSGSQTGDAVLGGQLDAAL